MVKMAIFSKLDLHFRDPSDGSRSVKIALYIVIPKNPKGQVAETSLLARRSLGVRAV